MKQVDHPIYHSCLSLPRRLKRASGPHTASRAHNTRLAVFQFESVATLPHGVGDRRHKTSSMSRSNGSGASANVSMIEARAQSRRDSRRDGPLNS